MAFFKAREKRLSKLPRAELTRRYERTESRLSKAAATGEVRKVKEAMKAHHEVEYALVYKTVEGSRRKK